MTCPLCEDRGFFLIEEHGRPAVKDCQCVTEKKFAARMNVCGIPPRYQRKTLDSYDPKISRDAAAALLLTRKWVDEWPVQRHLGLLLTGPVGVGKTHLMSSALMECMKRYGATVRFVDLPELFSQIKATFDPQQGATEMDLLKPLFTCDLLAIDEVGAARTTDWAFSMTEQILNTRYNADKATLFTTNFPNYPPGEGAPPAARPKLVQGGSFALAAGQSAAARVESLGDRIGARMFSRVQEMCKVIEMEGQDQRAAAGRKRNG